MRILAGFLFLAVTASAQTGVSDARYAHLGRGVNLTRWFQYGSRIPIGEADRDLLLKAGFTGVRIAVAPQYLLGRWASPEVVEKNLGDLDRGIELFLRAGMSVTLDVHADVEYVDYYRATPEAGQELIDLWARLARRYGDRDPELLFFEILNEPDRRFSQAEWDLEQMRVLETIRAVAPRHTVLLAPVNWSGLDGLLGMTPYDDPNVIYVMHYYAPAAFTHQGANWTDRPELAKLHDVPWPAFLPGLEKLIEAEADPKAAKLMSDYRREDWDAERVGWDMRLAAMWGRRWGARVIVNEFGDYKPFAPAGSRGRWLRDVRSAIEGQGMGWAVWDYAAGFDVTVLDGGSRRMDPEVSGALGLGTWVVESLGRGGESPAFSGLRTAQVGLQDDETGYAEGVAVGDFNGDGLPDLLVTPITWPSGQDHPVQLFLNAGNGVMTPGSFDGPAPVQRLVSAITPGHFDRSGRLGYLLSDRDRSLLLMPSGETLRDAGGNFPGSAGAAAGDLDGDGVDDLVLFRRGGLEPQVWLNDGRGNFRLSSSGLGPAAKNATCGVFAGADLLLFGRGLRGSAPDQGGPATGGCAAVGDLNGDGLPDVVVGMLPDVVQILINNGDGTFRDETAARLGALGVSRGGLRRVALARTNGGRNWALVLTRVGAAPLILAEHGDGVFVEPKGEPLVGGPWVVAPGDFNGDGYLDLMFARGGGAPLELRLGQGPI